MWASLGCFLYFALMFALPSGYSYGASVLLITSLYAIARRIRTPCIAEDKKLIGLFFSLFIWSVFAVLLHGDGLKTLDQSSRFLFAIPIFLLLLRIPPSLSMIFSGVVLGILLSNGIAAWQLEWLGESRASGFLNIIHFGNIGLVFGIFCVTGLIWANTLPAYKGRWRSAFAVGIAASVYTVVASGSRGSWLALPMVVIIFFVGCLDKRGAKYVLGGTAALVLAAAGLFAIPETGVRQRFDLATSEVREYFQERYVFRNGEVSSVGARLEIWRTALMNIPEKPLLGWGEQEYHQRIEQQVADKEIDPYMLQMANSHNNFLEVWIYQGLIGLLILLAVYFYPFYYFCRRLRSPDMTVKALALSGASLLASYFMFSMSQVILGRNNGVIFFVLTLVILWACLRNEERRLERSAASRADTTTPPTPTSAAPTAQ